MCDKQALRGDRTWRTCGTPLDKCPVEMNRYNRDVSDPDWECIHHRCERGRCEGYSLEIPKK